MRPAMDVVNRILWDENLPEHAFVVGYLDRFLGIKEKPITVFNFADDFAAVSHMETAIPQTRIQYLKYKHRDGSRIVWDRRPESRVDDVFGSFPPGNGASIETIMAQHPPQDGEDASLVADPTEEEEEEESARRPTRNAARPNFFICFRVLSPRVLERAQSLQRLSPETTEGAVAPACLHFTVLTLRLRHELEIRRACDALAAFNLAKVVDADQPIHVRGVDCFRNRVLHARADEADGSLNTLVRLHERLRNFMIDALGRQAWTGQDERDYVPHMTIAKCSREMSRRGASFPFQLYEPFLSESLGRVRIRALHLCRMVPPEDGTSFYETLVSSKPNISRWLPSAEDASKSRELLAWEQAQCKALRTMKADARQPRSLRGTLVVARGFPCASKTSFLLDNFPEAASCNSGARLRELLDLGSSDEGSPPVTIVLDDCFAQRCEFEDALTQARIAGFEPMIVEPCRGRKAWFEEVLRSGGSLRAAISAAQLALSFEHSPASQWFPLRASGPLPEPRKLAIFDFDRTLMDTPDPVLRPGQPRDIHFVSLPQSLRDEGAIRPGPAFPRWEQAAHGPAPSAVVVLTGRKETLRPEVEAVLRRFGLAADALIMKPAEASSSSAFKARSVRELSDLGFAKVVYYDDDAKALSAAKKTMAGHPAFVAIDANDLRREQTRQTSASSMEKLAALKIFAIKIITEEVKHHVAQIHPAMQQVDPRALATVFGSSMYGRQSQELDLCLAYPCVSTANDAARGEFPFADTLYRALRRGNTLMSGDEAVHVLDSHLAKRARCPRIAIHLQHASSGATLDVDIVMAALEPREALARFCEAGAPPPSPHELRALCVDAASVRSLEGPIFGAELVERARDVDPVRGEELLCLLVDETAQLLAAHGLRGRHLQMIRTFQIAMLAIDFLEKACSNRNKTGLFARFCEYINETMTEAIWTRVLTGLHDPEYAECHLMYLPRLIAAFRGESSPLPGCPFLAFARYVIIVQTRRPWKARIQLEAGFPRVLRSLESLWGSVHASSAGELAFFSTPGAGRIETAEFELFLSVSADHGDDGSAEAALRHLRADLLRLEKLPNCCFSVRASLAEYENLVISRGKSC